MYIRVYYDILSTSIGVLYTLSFLSPNGRRRNCLTKYYYVCHSQFPLDDDCFFLSIRVVLLYSLLIFRILKRVLMLARRNLLILSIDNGFNFQSETYDAAGGPTVG